jgi:hypothetical protein
VRRIEVYCDKIEAAIGVAKARARIVVAQVGRDVVVANPNGSYRVEFRG